MGQADSLRGQREELEARKDRTTDRLVHLKRILGTICLTKRVHCRCIIYCTPEMPFLYLKVEIFNLPTILEINSNPTFILFCFGKLGNLKYCLREKQGKRRHVLTFLPSATCKATFALLPSTKLMIYHRANTILCALCALHSSHIPKDPYTGPHIKYQNTLNICYQIVIPINFWEQEARCATDIRTIPTFLCIGDCRRYKELERSVVSSSISRPPYLRLLAKKKEKTANSLLLSPPHPHPRLSSE